VVPCHRVFPGSRVVATDLSAELLAMLGGYLADSGQGDAAVCVKMDAMSQVVTPGAFDLVTGASILHHLLRPEEGLAAAGRALKPGGHAIFFEPFNGWGVLRLAYERILAEAKLRADPLEPQVETILAGMIRDIAARSDPDTTQPWFPALDDKWLFSRSRITAWAREAGFADVRFAPHGRDANALYQATTAVTLRLASGRDDLALPGWATAILADFDAAITRDARSELMMEGTIVLTKGRS
jgi:SAM-dependent methyltransferase